MCWFYGSILGALRKTVIYLLISVLMYVEISVGSRCKTYHVRPALFSP